jgi:5-methylcytosine-specific restriction endonuclease McrA
MSDEPVSGPDRALTGDDPWIVWERCGGRCYLCGVILDRHAPDLGEVGGLLTYPVRHDAPRNYGIPLCDDCWMAHTDEQLDEYVRERQAQQWLLEEDRGDYAKNQGRAFERDGHTCQLCGQEGIPKAERGLIAYPVRARDYHLDSLVTICDDCLTDALDDDEDKQQAADQLRIRAARAKEWIDTDDEAAPDDDGGEP